MRRLLIAVCVCVLGSTTAALAAVSSGNYKGTTSQGRRALVAVRHRGIAAGIKWKANCGGGKTLTSASILSGRLHGDSFSGHGSHTVKIKGGFRARNHASIRLTISGRSVHGTFRVTSTVSSSSGQRVAKCRSPKIAFSATRR